VKTAITRDFFRPVHGELLNHTAMVFFRPQSQRDLVIRQGQDKSAVIQDMEDGEDAVVETKE
jgi:hypothetical protein